MRVDHACILPLKLFCPEGEAPVPLAPVNNTVQFQQLPGKRMHAWGKTVGEAIAATGLTAFEAA